MSKNIISNILKENFFYGLEFGQAKNQFEYFRITIGCLSLLFFIFYLLDYDLLLSSTGLITWEVSNANSYSFEPSFYKLSTFFGIKGNAVQNFAIVVYIICLLSIIAGRFVQLTAFVAFIIFRIFCIQLVPFVHGVELYQSVFLLFLIVFPSGISRTGKKINTSSNENKSQQYAIRGLQWFLIFTYTSAGYHKALMPQWYNGEMIYVVISDPNYRLLQFPTNLPSYIYIALGISTLVFEFGYSILLLIPYLRSILLVSVVMMHLFICLFMSLIPFGLLLASANIVLWYPLVLADFKKITTHHEKFNANIT
jgi:hypothetical protein